MIIWQDIPVKIRHKFSHIRKIGGKTYYAFANDWGDIPVARWNEQTKQIEEVQNFRGKAYAARKRKKYRKSIKH